MPLGLGGEFGTVEDSEEMGTQQQLTQLKLTPQNKVHVTDTLVDSPLLEKIVSSSATTVLVYRVNKCNLVRIGT